ncbi:Macrolide export ATP-binding/permease protein MacB [compost metagenome]
MSYLQQPGRYPLPGANLLGQMVFAVRADGDPLALLARVRDVVAAFDAERPVANVTTMAAQIRSRVPRRGDLIAILAAFAGVAVLLAAIGIYGIVSYTAACRTREIGVRIALGARAGHVARLVATRALVLVAGGVAAGLAGAVAITRLLQSQLWDISPTDPLTYVAGLFVLVVVCALACALPARRATAVNPTMALRCE